MSYMHHPKYKMGNSQTFEVQWAVLEWDVKYLPTNTRAHLQDVLHQLLLVVKGVLEAEEDAADDADDDHHTDDDERGRHNQDQQSHIIISKKNTNPLMTMMTMMNMMTWIALWL